MKVILIDDEPLALSYLEHILQSIGDFQVVGKYTNPLKGMEEVKEIDVDLIFLDIHFPKVNGIEIAEKLLEDDPSLNIVFVTAYDHYAVQAFELNALDYVLKPVQKNRLFKTIDRIKERIVDKRTVKITPQQKTRLHLFQQAIITTDEETAHSLHWRTKKVQQLFLYLIHNRNKYVEKDEIIDILWQDLEIKNAYSQLYTAIYHIRKSLEPLNEHFKLVNTSDGYQLEIDNIIIDVDEFDHFIDLELPISKDTIERYEYIISIAEEEYLHGFDYTWAENERQRLNILWLHIAHDVVQWLIDNDELEKALHYSFVITNRFPFEEKPYFLLMQIYAKMDENLAVHQQYEKLENMLQEEFNELPSSYTIKWYNEWITMK